MWSPYYWSLWLSWLPVLFLYLHHPACQFCLYPYTHLDAGWQSGSIAAFRWHLRSQPEPGQTTLGCQPGESILLQLKTVAATAAASRALSRAGLFRSVILYLHPNQSPAGQTPPSPGTGPDPAAAGWPPLS